MTEELPRETKWSRERWFLTVAIVFAVQVVLVIWLSGRKDLPVAVDSQKLLTHYYTAEMSEELMPLLTLLDPTMYARADREGFSGPVWLNVSPVEHRSAGWSDPPQFLKFKQERLLSELEQFGRSNQPRRRTVPEKLVGDDGGRAALVDQLKPTAGTTFEITGDLSVADLLGVPTLAAIEFDGVLAPSIMLVQVDQRGRVFSANLTGNSGLPDADQRAMKIARSLQFGIADGFSPTTDNRDFSNLRRARLLVHWATAPGPVPQTNAPPANPPPTVGPPQ